MFSRKTSVRTRQSRDRMLALKVNSPRILMLDAVGFCARFFKLGLAMAAMIVLGFGIAYGWDRLFVQNEEFLVQDVHLEVLGGGEPRFLTHDRLALETSFDPTGTIFSQDTAEIRDSLLALPEITSVKVSRRLPGILKIEVTERKPLAWVACRSLGIVERDPQLGFLVDEDYIVFGCASSQLQEYAETLPVIMTRTAARRDILEGEALGHQGLRFALDLVKRSNEELEGQERPAWVVVKDEITLEMKTLSGIVATFSYYDQDDQLTRLKKVASHARQQGQDLVQVNLIPRRFVPVHYR